MRVHTDQSPADSVELAPNPGPELLAPEFSWEALVGLTLVGLATFLAAAVLVLWLRRPRRAPARSALERALSELDDLGELGDLAHAEANGQDLERRYVLVADILRRYLSERFQLQAPKRTTPEFVRLLDSSSDLRKEHKATVADLLARADLVKFARLRPTAEETRGFLDSVRVLIRRTSEAPEPLPASPQSLH